MGVGRRRVPRGVRPLRALRAAAERMEAAAQEQGASGVGQMQQLLKESLVSSGWRVGTGSEEGNPLLHHFKAAISAVVQQHREQPLRSSRVPTGQIQMMNVYTLPFGK